GGCAAFGHDGVGLAQQRLAHEAGGHALAGALDRGAQAGTAGPDHDHVVGDRLDLADVHQKAPQVFRSVIVPDATARTYMSASAIQIRLTQAHSMWRPLNQVVIFQSWNRTFGPLPHEKQSSFP